MWQLQKIWHTPKPCNTWLKAQPPHLGKLYQLAESAWELCQVMQPKATFTDVEVLEDNPPSNWWMITPSRPTEPAQPDEGNWRERSPSRNWMVYTRGAFTVAHGRGHSKPTVTTWAGSPSLAPNQWAESPWEECHSWQLAPPPGFVEIASSLHGDNPPHEAMSIHWNQLRSETPYRLQSPWCLLLDFIGIPCWGPPALMWWPVPWS